MTEETIFAEALGRRTPADRAAYLDGACAGDPAMRARVEALLGSHEGGTAFLDVPAVEQAARVAPAGSLDETQAGTAVGDPAGWEPLDYLEPPTRPDALGRLGHYEVLEVVGRGGMGVVLRAFDAKLQRVVAIKVMAAELAASATARKRFIREAQAAAAVVNEHVVTIHAVEEDHRPPYLVMQFVEGVSLQEKIDREGALELREVLRIGMQAAEGLAAAHKQGLVHRDIKPANILLENGIERVKITDFGLARAADDASLTQSGVIAGTPLYMSPEQAEGHPLDHRSDLFSLGSVLYATCTGRAPFRAGSAVAVLRRVCGETPRPIREVNPEIPQWLCAVVDRLHAKAPADRYPSAAEVAALLGRHLARLQRPEHLPDDPTGEFAAPAARPAAPRRGRRRAPAAAALLAILIGAGLTEATGVTHVSGTVIRLLSPEGTLVVEVDDPGVSVAVDGSDVVITGAGAKEIRLKPGQYTVMASKRGKVIKQELVRVTRDGRQVVRVTREGADAPVQLALERARGHARKGRWEAVREDIEAAIGLAEAGPDWEQIREPFRGLVQICLELGQGRRVVEIQDQIAERRPLDIAILCQCWQAPLFYKDRDASRRARDRLVRGFGATTDPMLGFLVADALNMDPDPEVDRGLAVRLARLSVEGVDAEWLRNRDFVHDILAHACTQAGRQDDALRALERKDPAVVRKDPVWDDLLRAMILSRKGEPKEARRYLARTQAWDRANLTDRPARVSAVGKVEGWFRFKALLRQAEAVVAGRPVAGRPERFPAGSPADLLTSDAWEWTEPVNLGPVVNSPKWDGGPSLTADGLLMTFHSNRDGGLGDADLWECRRTSADAPFGPPAHLEGPINGPGIDVDPCLGPDGLTILFASDRPGGLGGGDLWQASRASRDEAWGEPVNLGSPVNGPGGEFGPGLSRDGLTLVFHSGRGGGLGSDDLWMSRRATRDVPFGDPTNLGPGVNHAGADQNGSLSDDGLALIYTRVGDLYLATRPSADATFGAARPLGPPINTAHWEMFPRLSSDGRTLYFFSLRPGGQGRGDLWMSRRVRKPRPPDPATADAAEWKRSVAELPAESQAEAVAARLVALNPGFDGKVTPTIEGGVVTGLKFAGDEVADLSPLRALPGLTALDCSNTQARRSKLRDLTPLRGLPLATLICPGTGVRDLEPLRGMPLIKLNCVSTIVRDLEPLRGMRLEIFNAGGTRIEDLSPLRGMPITGIYLGGTPVRDFSALEGMPLRGLNLGHTAVTDLGFLAGKSLNHLCIVGTAIRDTSVLRGMPLEYFECDFRADRDAEVLRSITTLKTINDKPAADFWRAFDARAEAPGR